MRVEDGFFQIYLSRALNIYYSLLSTHPYIEALLTSIPNVLPTIPLTLLIFILDKLLLLRQGVLPSGRTPQAQWTRKAISFTGGRNPEGIGRSRSQRRKSEVMRGRSRSGRPYLLRQAPCPKASHFPLGFISHSLEGRNPKGKRCGHVP